MTDTALASFVMYGSREAIGAGLSHIEQQVTSLERAVVDNPGLAFDLAKTLVESVCRTLLRERSISFSENDDLPRLFKLVSVSLPFLPATASSEAEVRQSLAQTLNGLHTAIQGICELRNECGFASHGAAGPRPALESVQALLAAQAADTIVGFLSRIHRQDGERRMSPRPRTIFDENPDFNEAVDDLHGIIRIYEAEFRPSEVLFQMEPETYRTYLTEFSVETSGSAAGHQGTEGTP